MVNKYNWSVIPSHVNYMATDEDGMACGWLVKPQIQGNAWRHQSHLSAFFNINTRDNYLNHFQGNWRESLEQRPDNRVAVKEAFLKVFSGSLHYKARKEGLPGNSDDFIFSYCYESDDFIDPVTSDAYLVFKHMYLENNELKGFIDEANAKASMCREEKNHAIKRWNTILKEREKLQKVLDAVICEIEKLHLSEGISFGSVKQLEQALNGVSNET